MRCTDHFTALIFQQFYRFIGTLQCIFVFGDILTEPRIVRETVGEFQWFQNHIAIQDYYMCQMSKFDLL